MKAALFTIGLTVATALSPITVQAQTPEQDDAVPLLTLGLGGFDQNAFWAASKGRRKSVEARVEYRFGTSLAPFLEPVATLRPWLAADVNTDAGLWGGGGVLLDVSFGNVVVTPSIGVGLWNRGNSKDLGYPVEFRTTLEAGYRFADLSRLTVFYSHKSNAGLSDDNHGVDSFGLSYHIPVSKLF